MIVWQHAHIHIFCVPFPSYASLVLSLLANFHLNRLTIIVFFTLFFLWAIIFHFASMTLSLSSLFDKVSSFLGARMCYHFYRHGTSLSFSHKRYIRRIWMAGRNDRQEGKKTKATKLCVYSVLFARAHNSILSKDRNRFPLLYSDSCI